MAWQVQANISRLYLRLNEFREGDRYCDVNIRVDEQSFKCHRLILAATCEYFDAMLGGNFKESGAEQITLHGIEASAFAEVLRFAYTGEVIVTAENACSLISASEFLKLSFIEELCMEYIKQKIPIQNAMNIFIFARATMKHTLTKVICEYIVTNFSTISKTAEFLDLPFDDFRVLFDQYRRDRQLKFGDDDLSLDVIVRWVDHAREERTSHLHDLMGAVDFKSVTPGYLQSMVKKFFGVSSSASSADSVELVSRNAPSMHVFVKFPHELCAENVWVIFSHINPDGWRYSHTLQDPDDTPHSREKHERERTIRNASLKNHLYSLTYNENQTPAQKFFRASSISLDQGVHRLKSPPMIVKRFDMCASENDIYLYDRAISEFHLYNREVDRWFSVAPLKQKVNGACVTTDSNLIYVIGGDRLAGKRHRGADYGLLQAYDSRTSSWKELPRCADNFVYAGCCMHEGKIYVSGDISGNKKMYIFDPVAEKWQLGAPMNLDCYQHQPQMVSYNGHVWAIGVNISNFARETSWCEVYDPVTQKWLHHPELECTVSKSIEEGTIQPFGSRFECTSQSSWEVEDAVIF